MRIDKKLSEVLGAFVQKNYPLLPSLIETLVQAGGLVFLVGGAVRDLLLGVSIKDLDIEIHGLSMEQLETILKKFGHVRLVGKQFGVLRIDGIDIDFSLPRKDSKGRKPEVMVDPNMSIEDAFRRRDLTINAMGIDMATNELVDPFDGYTDLKNSSLRAVDKKLFIEDPLRFYRVMQFAARFGMDPDAQLDALCQSLDLRGVSTERLDDEFKKMMLKSRQPSRGFRWLKKIGRLHDLFPELYALIDVPQRNDYHPEGDVFEHTMQSLDAAAELSHDLPEFDRLVLMYAALCHDVGKPATTQEIKGVIQSPGHAQEGEPLTEKLLRSITHNNDIITAVKKLVRYHMEPLSLVSNNAKPAAYKRLAGKLAPETYIALLALLARADQMGRFNKDTKASPINFDALETFIKNAQEAMVEHRPEEPLLQGRDIMDLVKPGPAMGNLLKKAYEIQIDEGVRDKDALKKRIVEILARKK